MRYDADLIKKDAEPLDVAIALGYRFGVDMQQNGQSIRLICPSHKRILGKADNHLGSCVLTKYGTKCFACAGADPKTGGADDVFQMVMDVKECSFKTAVAFVAETLPNPEAYALPDEEDFSYEEMELLKQRKRENEMREFLGLDCGRFINKARAEMGLPRRRDVDFKVIGMCYDEDTKSDYESVGCTVEPEWRLFPDLDYGDGDYMDAPFLICEKVEYTLDDFMNEDPVGYASMIADKKKEKMAYLLDKQKRADSLFREGALSREGYKEISDEILKDKQKLLSFT